jgi:hypothetical protein
MALQAVPPIPGSIVVNAGDFLMRCILIPCSSCKLLIMMSRSEYRVERYHSKHSPSRSGALQSDNDGLGWYGTSAILHPIRMSSLCFKPSF